MQRVLLYAAAVAVLLLGTLFISACASRFGYGHTALVREDETIEDLLDNWEDYRVFYSGIHAHRPSGLAIRIKINKKGLPANREAFFVYLSAATYSPTQSPAQYHRR